MKTVTNYLLQENFIDKVYALATPAEREIIQYAELGEPIAEEDAELYYATMKSLVARAKAY